mmetsp:Transcript_27697/g.65037  ORF Transcript_27697/g.65037 Transcript_27697/m.65037 type:complete len:204 (+) Transcript_27697:2696-3307(+)
MNHLASWTLQTSSRHIKTLFLTNNLAKSSLIDSRSPPWNLWRLSARVANLCRLFSSFKLLLPKLFDDSAPSKLDPEGTSPILPPSMSSSLSKKSPSPKKSSGTLTISCLYSSSYNRRMSRSDKGPLPRWIHAIPSVNRSRTSTVWIAATAKMVFPLPALSPCRDVMEVTIAFCSFGDSSSTSLGPAPVCSSKQLTTCFISLCR